MCGIVGFIDFNKTSTKEILKEMTNILIHRGPDSGRCFFEKMPNFIVGLGHRRLSILDLSVFGHQPMFFKELVIVYNGEVYNFKEIRKELEKYGYTFKSNSDTEVILKAFHKWGIDCVHKFRGMWAFAIWDKKNQRLILCRDRVGVKPLYWYYKNGLFLFASELKAFYKHPRFEKKLNFDGLSLYFQFGYIPAPFSISQNTYKLEPGYYLEVTPKRIKKQKYWDVLDYYLQGWELSLQGYWGKKKVQKEIEEELENLLIEAFKYRLVSDVPVGIFLSGGIDSTLVTTLLQKYSNCTLRTFSIGFYEKEYNEAPWAKKIAQYLGTEHNEYYCSIKEVAEIIPKFTEIYDEPFGDSSGIPTYLLSKFTRQKVKVSLSGDGGDELFCGYPKYWKLAKVDKFKDYIPNFIGIFLGKAVGLLKNQFSIKLKSKIIQIEKFLKKDFINLFNVVNNIFTGKEVNILLNLELNNEINIFENDNCNRYLNKVDLPTAMMIIDFKKSLPDQMLVKIDRATMSVGLEGREPLLDHKIVEYGAKMPLWLKYRNGQSKYILRKIIYKYIPSKLIDRPKRGFGIAHHEWFKKYIQKLYCEYLSEEKLKKSNINWKYVNSLLKFKNYNHINSRLWLILVFQMWQEKWM